MIKAVIMDFDGLIIDTEVAFYELYVEWFKVNKNHDLSIEDFLVCVGSGRQDLFNKLRNDGVCDVDISQFNLDIDELFINKSKLLPPKEGVVEFIKEVKDAGLKLALATSSKKEQPVRQLERLGILKYFDVIVSAEDVVNIKPCPDLFLKAVEKLEINCDEAIVVEDSLNGLKAGLNANIKVIVIPNCVTKYCNFKDYYKKYNSLLEINIKDTISNLEN